MPQIPCRDAADESIRILHCFEVFERRHVILQDCALQSAASARAYPKEEIEGEEEVIDANAGD